VDARNIAQDMADSAVNLDDCMNAMKDFVGQMIAAIALLDARLAVLESKSKDGESKASCLEDL
jgi:hypothetical protein